MTDIDDAERIAEYHQATDLPWRQMHAMESIAEALERLAKAAELQYTVLKDIQQTLARKGQTGIKPL